MSTPTTSADNRTNHAPEVSTGDKPDTRRSLRAMMGRYDGPRDIGDQLRLANALAGARSAVPDMYRGQAGDILAAMYQAIALDVSVMTALQQFHWNKGKSGMSGVLMKALIIRAGHKIVDVEVSDKKVKLHLERGDDQPSGDAEWSIGKAVTAGLTKKDVWQWYPEDMLYWRALSKVARRYAPDVVQGFGYTPEELSSVTVDDVQDLTDLEPVKVDPDVAEVIAGIADSEGMVLIPFADIRGRWQKAKNAGLLDRHAGAVDGVAYTTGDLIQHYGEIARQIEEDARRETQVLTDPPANEAETPAGEGRLDCVGRCPAAVVIDTGDHLEGCPDRAGDRQATS